MRNSAGDFGFGDVGLFATSFGATTLPWCAALSRVEGCCCALNRVYRARVPGCRRLRALEFANRAIACYVCS